MTIERSGWIDASTLAVTRQCIDCRFTFDLSKSEVEWFHAKGFTLPTRCKPCRATRRQQRAAEGGR